MKWGIAMHPVVFSSYKYNNDQYSCWWLFNDQHDELEECWPPTGCGDGLQCWCVGLVVMGVGGDLWNLACFWTWKQCCLCLVRAVYWDWGLLNEQQLCSRRALSYEASLEVLPIFDTLSTWDMMLIFAVHSIIWFIKWSLLNRKKLWRKMWLNQKMNTWTRRLVV